MGEKVKEYHRFYFIKIPKDEYAEVFYETKQYWNVVCKSFPYDIMGEAKDLPTVDWIDDSGVEVYVPEEEGLPLKAQRINLEFVCCSADARRDIMNFRNFLTGASDGVPMFNVYDAYTGLYGEGVVYQKFSPDILWRREGVNEVVVFKVELLFTKPLIDSVRVPPRNGDFNLDFSNDMLINRI